LIGWCLISSKGRFLIQPIKVDEPTRHIAVAAAWGLLPERDATYLNYKGAGDPRTCQKATYQVPENNAFWSTELARLLASLSKPRAGLLCLARERTAKRDRHRVAVCLLVTSVNVV
jgi:hypothetical protein